MKRRPTGLTFDDVRTIAAALPGVEEGKAWGVPALKLRGTMVACMAAHKSAEPNTLVVRLPFDQRDAIIADAPQTYSLRKPGTSMSSSDTRSFLISVSSAETRGLLS